MSKWKVKNEAEGTDGLALGYAGSKSYLTDQERTATVAWIKGQQTLSVEQVLAWNPDIIITIDRDFAANVRSDPQWAEVAAVGTRILLTNGSSPRMHGKVRKPCF